ncbi:hypothetical protein SAMN05660748_1091 [Blastococcus aggregatus]|uniref:Fibronectin type III domain-containing protein n=1 Tax=Blastococcus aggregatus TaxID=38502 RepID=A0A285V2Q2_9ACTN|nr:Ig-like domain-containing protein [Blastococcus aggregatus]SOC47868.1 hypothetical protein SAMN05660748_1091 [Blastococcus aggregatus]
MQLTSSPRRALGLLAVGTIGMSTAVLGVTGTASAGTESWTFTTASSGAEQTSVTLLEIAAAASADCTVSFTVDGAGGGAGLEADGSTPGAPGGRVTGEISAIDGDSFDLFAGTVGGTGENGTAGAAGTNAHGYDGSAGNTDGTTFWGGGGGGASTVSRFDDSPVLGAYGGDGAVAEASGSGAGGLDNENLNYVDGVDGIATNTGAGVISGTVTCVSGDAVAPGAPTLDGYVDAGDGTAKFWFDEGSDALDEFESYVPSSYEYKVTDGQWTAFTPGFTGSDQLTGTITGLTNLKKYSLVLRAVSASGTSPESAPVEFTPFAATPAPATVAASVGVSSVRVSWTPPADAAGIKDYIAIVAPAGAQSSQDVVVCISSGTSCTVKVKAGMAYGFGVASRDALGNEGDRTWGENPTAVVPASAIAPALPTSNGTLGNSDTDGTIVAGTPVTLTGAGFAPGSTVELVAYSTPVKLGEAVVLADGTFTATVTVPATLTNGVHHLVATGVDPAGNVRNLVVEVTVSGGTAVLASTGFSTLPYLGTGALALLAGGGLLVAARRRNAA